MNRIFPALLLLGLMIWGFLMVSDRSGTKPERSYATTSAKIENANVSDRCAKYRRPVGAEEDWSLSYSDRIAQVFSGCF